MTTFFQQPRQQSSTEILAGIIAATTLLFRRREPAINGLEVSDSTWEAWEAATRLSSENGRSWSAGHPALEGESAAEQLDVHESGLTQQIDILLR
jgi:hypothetical protein